MTHEDDSEPSDEILYEPAEPPPGELWVSLTLPDVPSLTDEQLEEWFPGYDGKWSSQTKTLVQQFEATGLDLNWSWTDVSPNWQCVCCRRLKPEIVRKTESGILICHLEWHHDHITDLLGHRLNERFGIPWPKGVPEASRLAEEPIKALLRRFRNALICDACNRADGRAKDALKGEIHPYFSFTPSQIAQFISSQPNRHHEIDVDKARLIWNEAKDDFEDRIGFMDLMIDRLAAGRHGVERHGAAESPFPQGVAERVLTGVRHLDPTAREFKRWYYRVSSDLGVRSAARDAVGRSARVRTSRPVRSPRDEEFAAFDNRAHLGWKRLPSDWACPCCGRDKRGIMRLSNQGKWFGQVRDHQVFYLERDVVSLRLRPLLYPWHPPEPIIRNDGILKVCSDCDDVSSELQRSRPDLMPFHLSLADLKACIGDVRPNQKLEIDLAEAAVRAQANAPWIEAREAFLEHAALATRMNARRASIERRRPLEQEDWDWIISLAEERDVRLEGPPGALEWLIREGQRLSSR